jgi:hypothetical protein
MLGSVDRMARVAQRIDAMREREHERYSKQRVHGIHPDMIPKVPPGWTDPQETLKAAIERGENPFPDDPEKLAYILAAEELFPSVNSGASRPREAEERGSPSRSEGEPGGGSTGDGLYSPVNLDDEPLSHSETDSQRDAAAARDSEAVSGPPAPSLPRAAGEGGSLSRSEGEPGGGSTGDGLYSPVNSDDPLSHSETDSQRDAAAARDSEAMSEPPAPSLPRAAEEGGDPGLDPGEPGGGLSSDANTPEEDALHSSVNYEPPPGAADAAPPSLPDGSRLATVLGTAAAMREPLYLNPE